MVDSYYNGSIQNTKTKDEKMGMRDLTLEILETYLASEDCFAKFGDDTDAAEEYFWENMDEMVDMYG